MYQFELLANASTILRERELNDAQNIGQRTALKTAQAVWGDKNFAKLSPIVLDKNANSSVIDKRNAKVLKSLQSLGII